MTETVFHTNGNYKSLTSLVQQNEGGRDCLGTNCVHMREEEEVFNLKKNHNRMEANWYELTLINRTTTKNYINEAALQHDILDKRQDYF